ncbi:MAG: ATP-binding protein [Phycisphaerae bacterium]|nr:ATP-binding protein [Phycisphaerae bacterium]
MQHAIDRAIASLIRAPEKDGISLRVHQECDGATVALDSTRLIQVVLNLLLNAKKAIGGSRGAITIHVARHEGGPKPPSDGLCLCSTWNIRAGPKQNTNTTQQPNKNQPPVRSVVVIRVANTGPVVDAAQIAGQVAGQVDEADGLPSARQWGGRGLGLFICAQIVRQAGGELWARCPREGGAEFTVVLPTAQLRAGGRAAA